MTGFLLLTGSLLVIGHTRLYTRSQSRTNGELGRSVLLLTGLLALALALVSPLESLSGTLLAAHMTQHVILVTVAPLLLVLGRPEAAMLWALPRNWRRALGRSRSRKILSATWRRLERPLTATILHGIALWLWHAPFLFNAALENSFVHDLEHLSFFLTALLFWSGVTRARAPAALAGAAICCLATLIHSGFLGALLTFSAVRIYSADAAAIAAWGLTSLSDQQLAGLIMWVPGGIAYLGAALALSSGLLKTDGPTPEPSSRSPVA